MSVHGKGVGCFVFGVFLVLASPPPTHHSPSRIASLYFLFDVFNVFMGTVLGGSLINSFKTVLKDPARLPKAIGAALPTTSNFWLNYMVLQVALVPLHFLFPHVGVLADAARGLRCAPPPRTAHARLTAIGARSPRYGKEVGAVLLVYLVCLAYCAVSPTISAIAFAFFALAWLFWRYSALYLWERAYESGGRVFEAVFSGVLWSLAVAVFFTGCVFIVNQAYLQGSLLWMTLLPLIYHFATGVSARYGAAVERTPLEAAASAPAARLDPIVYTAPALRRGAAGWSPEAGKVWEGWNAPLYVR